MKNCLLEKGLSSCNLKSPLQLKFLYYIIQNPNFTYFEKELGQRNYLNQFRLEKRRMQFSSLIHNMKTKQMQSSLSHR